MEEKGGSLDEVVRLRRFSHFFINGMRCRAGFMQPSVQSNAIRSAITISGMSLRGLELRNEVRPVRDPERCRLDQHGSDRSTSPRRIGELVSPLGRTHAPPGCPGMLNTAGRHAILLGRE